MFNTSGRCPAYIQNAKPERYDSFWYIFSFLLITPAIFMASEIVNNRLNQQIKLLPIILFMSAYIVNKKDKPYAPMKSRHLIESINFIMSEILFTA